VFGERTKETGPIESRALHDDVNGDQAFVVRHLRLRGAEPAETVLEAFERDDPVAAGGSQPTPRRLGIVSFEMLRQALV